MNTKTNHSQNGIEDIVFQFFPQSKGFFVEVGCWDGELISQTKTLEDFGWAGICIDPFPRNFQNRSCTVFEFAVSKHFAARKFIKVSIDRTNGGDVSYFSHFASDPSEHDGLILANCDYEEVTVATAPLTNLLDLGKAPRFIEFLSVDVEGAELEVFESLNFNKFSFGVITFEHNKNEERRAYIQSLLHINGYQKYTETEIDDVFIGGHLIK